MHSLKEKVTEKFSRLFPDSTNSSPPSLDHRLNQARPYSKGGKSLNSYFSYIKTSIGFDGSGADKHQHEFKLIPSLPVRYGNRNSGCQDELLDSPTPCSYTTNEKKETQSNQPKDEILDDKASGGSPSASSEVFEEALDHHSWEKRSLHNLMDESVFISPDLYEFLSLSIPNIVKGCQWVLLYSILLFFQMKGSTLKHGISLRTLIRRSADLSGPCLLIVGDKQGAVFGGLLDCPLRPTAKRKFQGTNQTFVFTTIYGEPRLFRPTGANRYYYLCLDDQLTLGAGGNFALCLDGDLLNGTSGPCETFGNMCLAHKPEFELKNVELWGFAHASKYLT